MTTDARVIMYSTTAEKFTTTLQRVREMKSESQNHKYDLEGATRYSLGRRFYIFSLLSVITTTSNRSIIPPLTHVSYSTGL